MAKKFLVNLDLGGNQLLSTRIHNNSGNPTAYGAGQLFWDSSVTAAASALKVYTGTSWVSVSSGGGGGGGVTTLNSLSGALDIYGRTNQITVSATSSSITLALSASTVTIGSTAISLGNTSTTLAGLTNVNSTSFVGTLYGTASAVTNGVYTTDTGTVTSAMIADGTIVNGDISSTAAITPNKLSASTITVGSTAIGLGVTSTTLAGLTTVTSSSFVGTLSGVASGVIGATSVNTNNAYVVRDANGRAQFTDPSAAQDAATKNYVDTVAQGLNTHDAVKVATTTNLSATYTNGTTDASGGLGIGASLTATANGVLSIDGFSPAVNDRVLVKNQSTGLQNGVYYVSASGTAGSPWSLIRAEDGNNSIAGEMANGDFLFVISGTTQSSTGWVLNSTTTTGTPVGAIKIGTDTVTYTQFSGQGTYVAGNGIVINGNTFTAAVGTGFTFSSGSIAYGSGTTTQTATGVSGGTYSYGTQKQVATITGNGSLNSFVVNHNLNSRDVNVRVYQTSTTPDTQYADVEVDITRTTTSTITINFASNVANGDTYNVVITG